jgi:hypothetical protein
MTLQEPLAPNETASSSILACIADHPIREI